MIITLSGKAWSGKGTVGRLLAEKLWYTYLSIGDMKRMLAKKMWLTISEFNALWSLPENREKFDLAYEEYQKNLDVHDNIILDSRLGFYCQPHAFKVYLDVSDEEAARRIFFDTTRTGDRYDSLDTVLEITRKRNYDDAQRFLSLYHIDITDPRNFDLIIHTDNKTPQEVVDEILDSFCKVVSCTTSS